MYSRLSKPQISLTCSHSPDCTFCVSSEPAMPGIWLSLLAKPWLWTGSWLNRMAWKTSSNRKSRLLLPLMALLCAFLLLPTPSWPGAGSGATSPKEGPCLLLSFDSFWPLLLLWETVPELSTLTSELPLNSRPDCPETLPLQLWPLSLTLAGPGSSAIQAFLPRWTGRCSCIPLSKCLLPFRSTSEAHQPGVSI